MMKKSIINSVISGLCLASTSVLANVEVGVRFVVDDALITSWRSEETIRDELERWILETNTMLSDSNIAMRLYPAETVMSDMAADSDESVIFNNMRREINGFNNLENRADEIGADYTIAVVPRLDNGLTGDDRQAYCGIANTVSRNIDEINAVDFMDSTVIVDYDCSTDTFAHELGHVFGLSHGIQVAEALGSTGHNLSYHAYSKGWGRIVSLASVGDSSGDEVRDDGEYGTIMVGNYLQYWSRRNATTFVGIFSNPDITDVACGENGSASPCGNALLGNAARTIRDFRTNFAAHATPDVHTLNYRDSNLRSCISQTYPYTPGSSVYDINRITSISCSASDIGSIDGLEGITGLHSTIVRPTPGGWPVVESPFIDLSDNRIVNLDALYQLSSDSTINLQGNDVASCHQLDELEQTHTNLIRPERCLNIAALVSTITMI
ncbi:hypothetical protein PRUB_b0949 [Pseudoalteromonas rubra]|uniref:Peptidase M43 pregnancy-associated plasma-A domain-containing protein n=1 Tax=Pseudoalteromonas rubra TaxID=43658 RepID=A0A8T0C0W2_9GAMM|nr:hypothetical protein PRUB_b0949 [Pseudoalteromonas rubra]